MQQATREGSAAGNATRACTFAGQSPSAHIKITTKTEFASSGKATNFGELSVTHTGGVTVSNPTRGVTSGGSPGINTMEYTSLSTGGNAADFGDLTGTNTNYTSGNSNAHGGLG